MLKTQKGTHAPLPAAAIRAIGAAGLPGASDEPSRQDVSTTVIPGDMVRLSGGARCRIRNPLSASPIGVRLRCRAPNCFRPSIRPAAGMSSTNAMPSAPAAPPMPRGVIAATNTACRITTSCCSSPVRPTATPGSPSPRISRSCSSPSSCSSTRPGNWASPSPRISGWHWWTGSNHGCSAPSTNWVRRSRATPRCWNSNPASSSACGCCWNRRNGGRRNARSAMRIARWSAPRPICANTMPSR